MDSHGALYRGAPRRRAAAEGGLLALMVGAAVMGYPSSGAADPPSIPTPYHNGSTLVCSDCHSMHASQQHSYAGGGSVAPPAGPPETYPWSTTPTGKLLRKASAAEMCLACHDGQLGVPDVVDADVNGLGDNRAAGFFAALGAANYKGHKLTTTSGSSPCNRCHNMFGEGPPATGALTCTDCHNPHGNGAYRNIQRRAHASPPNQPKAIAFTDAADLNKYDQNHIGYSTPAAGDNTWREPTYLCAGIGCHGYFFSTASGAYTGSTSPYKKHPGTNSQEGVYFPINRVGAHTDPTNWVNGTNGFGIGRLPFLVRGATTYAEATTVAADNEVFCLSCHKAHGSGNAFGLRWAYGTGPPGTGQAGCEQCHNK